MRKTVGPSNVALDGLQGGRSGLEMAINAEYYVPGMIELENEELVWNWNGNERLVTHFEGLLNAFVGLHSGSAARVLDFARQWGVLHECRVHKPPQEGEPTVPAVSFCLFKHPKGHAESLADWQGVSRVVDATLRISYDLAMDQPGTSDNWKLFYGSPEIRGVGDTVNFDRRVLMEHLNDQLFAGLVRPQIRWRNGRWGIDFHVGSLQGAIAAQMTLVVAQQGIAVCASCGCLFSPKQLKPGKDAYCNGPHCGRKAADRAAHRRRSIRARGSQSR